MEQYQGSARPNATQPVTEPVTEPSADPSTDSATSSVTAAEAASLSSTMFRAYDIRGLVETELTPSSIHLIGRAIGSLALEHGHSEVLFGADSRLSSPTLAAALQAGILASGCNILDLGIIPTPLLYFATHTTHCNSGVMLTASHNPAEYNGIKIVRNRSCLTPEQIQAIRERALQLMASPDAGSKPGPDTVSNAGSEPAPDTGPKAGSAQEPGAAPQPARRAGTLKQHNILTAYLERVAQDVRLARPLKVVVDCGNAVPGLVAPGLFKRLGCDVIPLYCEPDGHFPNHHPDPTVAGNLTTLIDEVIRHRADLGIALDGDGDRVVMVTDQGNIIDTDRLLMLLVRDIVPRYKRPNVVFDVKCSKLLADEIIAHGGQPVMSRSGHSFMKFTMQETQAVVGGEFSAHIFIKDRWFGYDDGLYTAARFLEILAAGHQTAEAMLRSLPTSMVTPELRIDVDDDQKFILMEKIASAASFPKARINRLDGIRADFRDGWGLIRASNTTPALLLRFEAHSTQSLLQIQEAFRQLLKQVDKRLDFALPAPLSRTGTA